MPKFENITSVPVYSEKTGKLRGWQLSWVAVTPYFEINDTRFFKEGLFRNSYRAMCRFRQRVMGPYENTK